MHARIIGPVVALLLTLGARGAPAQDFQLTVDNIMRGPELVGRSPQGLRGGFGGGGFSWSPDSKYLWFRWQQPGMDTSLVVYRTSPAGGAPERFEKADPDTILAGAAEWSPDRSRAVFQLRGDLVLWTGKGVRRLTDTQERESSPQWSADGKTLYFQRGGNAFALNTETAESKQLTDIRRGNAPREREPDGQRKVIADEQKELFDFIRSGRYKEQPWNAGPQEDSTRPKPFYPGENKNVAGMRVAPDGKFVLLTVVEQPRDAKRVQMPLWITEDGYIGTNNGRTYVGDKQATSRAAILEVATGKVTFVGDSVGGKDKSIAGVAVSSTSAHALLRVETRDDEYRYWVVVDLPGLAERIVAQDHDSAWIGFPGPALPSQGGFFRTGRPPGSAPSARAGHTSTRCPPPAVTPRRSPAANGRSWAPSSRRTAARGT
jgi:hypothetical protein